MQGTSLKPLYLAKSIKELDNLASKKPDYKTKTTSQLVSSANTLFQAAEKSALERDEERAYTLFMRYIDLILDLKKRTDFQKNRDYKLILQQANPAIVKAENLKTSLKDRYPKSTEENNCKTKNEINERISSLHNQKTDVPAENDIIKNENGVKSEEPVETSISSSKLYSLLTTNHSNIVLMDLRPEKDFEESHIKHNNCINVPQEVLSPGVTAATVERNLPVESLSCWGKRGDAEYVILIDWDTSDDSRPSLHLNTLKQAMCKWDQKCSLKQPPLILLGGYKDWMLKYPMLTTRALNFSNFDLKTSPVLGDISGVEYPDFETNPVKKNKENINGPGPLFKKSSVPPPSVDSNNLPSNDSVDSRNTKSAPSFDRKAKPTIPIKPSSAASKQSKLNGFDQNQINGVHISSSNSHSPSPVTPAEKMLNGNHEDTAQFSSLIKEENLAKNSLELAKEQLSKEQEFEKLCLRKEKEAEESKRIEIQKQEGLLIEKLKQLDIAMSAKDVECKKVKEENAEIKKRLNEYMDKELHAKKEKEIITAEIEKKKLQEQVRRLREERKIREAKKKLESKPETVIRNVVSANSDLKRHVSHQDQNDGLNNEYTVPLLRQNSSDSASRGLVRSHSSPNIAQMINQEETTPRKKPVIDRSLKPSSTPTYQPDLCRARLRNLNPVYGNCPATGLKNLGNTCFMNSVIQCLANTLPLVDYFTSNEYSHDIVRDSRQTISGEVAEEFAVVLKSLWMGQYKFFSPKDFKNTVSKCLSVCIGNEQQDSHEFYVVLMEKLHADLNRKTVKTIPKLDPNHDESGFWHHHKSFNDSRISEVFEGLLKSTLTCLTCRKTSDSYEVFSCLSLPISTSKCSLRDCFMDFLKSEKISGEAAWECPRCKQKKEAEKRLRICRLPHILVVQLKRFSYEGLWRRKLQTHVDFDIQFEVPYERNSEERFRKYTLYGIVNHYGTLEGGHYIAFCNAPSSNKWYKYDDHEVSEISLSDIKTPAAYMLFYHASDFRSSL